MIGDTIGDVMGEEVARRCGPVWGLDKEGELRSVRISSSLSNAQGLILRHTTDLAQQWTSSILGYGWQLRIYPSEIQGPGFTNQSC